MNNHQNAIFHQITNFLKTPLALLGVDLKNFQFNKICHFANHPYLCKGLINFVDNYFMQTIDIIRKCVHCGFCLATCPTYQLLGNELDSPRGRIYLIKSALENNDTSTSSLQHLDRCLTCRALSFPRCAWECILTQSN